MKDLIPITITISGPGETFKDIPIAIENLLLTLGASVSKVDEFPKNNESISYNLEDYHCNIKVQHQPWGG